MWGQISWPYLISAFLLQHTTQRYYRANQKMFPARLFSLLYQQMFPARLFFLLYPINEHLFGDQFAVTESYLENRVPVNSWQISNPKSKAFHFHYASRFLICKHNESGILLCRNVFQLYYYHNNHHSVIFSNPLVYTPF